MESILQEPSSVGHDLCSFLWKLGSLHFAFLASYIFLVSFTIPSHVNHISKNDAFWSFLFLIFLQIFYSPMIVFGRFSTTAAYLDYYNSLWPILPPAALTFAFSRLLEISLFSFFLHLKHYDCSPNALLLGLTVRSSILTSHMQPL